MKNIIEDLYEKSAVEFYDGAFIGTSALKGDATAEETAAFCDGLFPSKKCAMSSDIKAAFEGLRFDGPAALLICGTGSVVCGRLADGSIIKKGGWGYVLGDEGSAYAISRDAMRAALKAYDGSCKPTMLTKALLEYFEVSDAEQLMKICYNPVIDRTRVSKFCRDVMKCVSAGDETAIALVSNQCAEIANTTIALLKEMPEGSPVALWGGVLQGSEIYRSTISRLIKSQYPDIYIDLPPYPPEIGAVFAAMKNDGLKITDEIITNLSSYTTIL